ncbi:hypothetical protein DFR29_118130 [Tahibacter aquaticus]|jgi:hypothetical protein|uniref:Uncharacterized protein n=1 Tax=Tahibacter aquaticus TaxID=520092 RepID=A0A4R6YNK8_9GAMM|nr:hypothetical protein [Tahibacter aquaticus]TDR38987.1 hypothetical protein DFR29_118130 [Tahibacter aquaticus]
MDVCLPEEFLRLTAAADAGESDTARRDEWLGADAWISGVPQRAGSRRAAAHDDPTWMVS